MEKVEQDLEKSKISREKQAKEFTRQLESEKNLHEKLVSVLSVLLNSFLFVVSYHP